MNTPEKLRETLADVIAKHNDASASHALLHSQWHEAAAKGEDAKADKLEIEIEKARRLMMRLDLRRTSLEQDIGNAEAIEAAARAAKLKATADSILARAGKRIADIEPLCGTLAELVRALEADFHDWKEARHYAKAEGASPEGFATQENDARVSCIVESLGMSKNRVGSVAKEMSRVSVFM